jgi:hypothetical protein
MGSLQEDSICTCNNGFFGDGLSCKPCPVGYCGGGLDCTVCQTLATVTVEIARFQTLYTLSDITDYVRNKFAAAIAYLIDLNVSYIVLRFSERRRTLIQGAIVAVFVQNFHGSIAGLQSRLILDRINLQMAAWGLEPVDKVLGIACLYTTVHTPHQNNSLRISHARFMTGYCILHIFEIF